MSSSRTKRFEIGLNIHLISISLPTDLIKSRDKIRVSITTMPEEVKQNFKIRGRKIKNLNHVFSLNVTNQTKKIVLVFRKKSLMEKNPIIASAIISASDLPQFPQSYDQLASGTYSTETKAINILDPLSKQIKEERQKRDEMGADAYSKTTNNNRINRKIIGQMQVQLAFTTPYLDDSYSKNNMFGFSAKSKSISKKRNSLSNEN